MDLKEIKQHKMYYRLKLQNKPEAWEITLAKLHAKARGS